MDLITGEQYAAWIYMIYFINTFYTGKILLEFKRYHRLFKTITLL